MDCAALRSDIDKLEQELRALGEKVETAREAEEHDKELQEVAKLIGSNSADLMLEKYLKDFQELPRMGACWLEEIGAYSTLVRVMIRGN